MRGLPPSSVSSFESSARSVLQREHRAVDARKIDAHALEGRLARGQRVLAVELQPVGEGAAVDSVTSSTVSSVAGFTIARAPPPEESCQPPSIQRLRMTCVYHRCAKASSLPQSTSRPPKLSSPPTRGLKTPRYNPRSRAAFCLRMSGRTSSLIPIFSKSDIHRSGVIQG